MKFNTEISDSEDKNITGQQRVDFCTPKMVKPLTIVPSIDSKRQMVSKSSTYIRKPIKKGRSKQSKTLVEEKNQPNATKEGTTTRASKKRYNEEAYQITSNVATPVC
jgi:hypothetical protein